jgi:hypothetical protein
MNKTFADIKTNIGTNIQDTSTPMATIIGVYANNRYFQILRSINWDNIRYDYTFDTVAGTQDYAMPEDFSKPMYVVDTTNKIELAEGFLQDLAQQYTSTISSNGTVGRYIMLDSPVKIQPSSSAVVSISSSSTSDTTQTIRISGRTSAGDTKSETISLSGTGSVSSTGLYTSITAISKSAVTTGYITVVSGTRTLAVLSPSITVSYYRLMRLHEVPSAVYTISAPYIVKPLPMVNATDYPAIDVADLIEIGATADAQRYKKQFSKAQSMEVLFAQGLAQFIYDRENQPNKLTLLTPNAFNRNNLY